MPIASAPISSPIVDQHPVATTDIEPIEDVDPIAPDVNIVALDVVMSILYTCKNMKMMWVMYQIRLTTKKPLLVFKFIAAPTSHLWFKEGF